MHFWTVLGDDANDEMLKFVKLLSLVCRFDGFDFSTYINVRSSCKKRNSISILSDEFRQAVKQWRNIFLKPFGVGA